MKERSGVAAAVLACVIAVPTACTAEAGWRQDDWSGGPNQALFQDSTRYDSSARMDTRNIPGKVRISFLSSTYLKDASNPVLEKGAAGEWDEHSVTGWPRRKDDATGYQVLYRGEKGPAGSEVQAVGYAESPDGIVWTKHPGNPILRRSGTAQWDAEGVGVGPLVLDGDTYHMFFKGYGADNVIRYGHARSTDLKTWSRSADHVFGPGAPGQWDGYDIWDLKVGKIGAIYHAWYTAANAV